jgi:hypothetical protein
MVIVEFVEVQLQVSENGEHTMIILSFLNIIRPLLYIFYSLPTVVHSRLHPSQERLVVSASPHVYIRPCTPIQVIGDMETLAQTEACFALFIPGDSYIYISRNLRGNARRLKFLAFFAIGRSCHNNVNMSEMLFGLYRVTKYRPKL